jgi:hypothetical protein
MAQGIFELDTAAYKAHTDIINALNAGQILLEDAFSALLDSDSSYFYKRQEFVLEYMKAMKPYMLSQESEEKWDNLDAGSKD